MRERLTYSNVVATLALFLALGLGGAYAADKITSKDIAKDAVTSKAIKNKTVKSKDVKDKTLTGADYKDGSVGSQALAPTSVVNLQLLNGGEGDCIWNDFTVDIPPLQPASYRRNAVGEVTFSGGVGALDGPGGDGACDGAGPESNEDSTVAIIPPADRPARAQIYPSNGAVIIIAGVNGLQLGATSVPAGAIQTAISSPAILSDISYLAADAPGSPAPASGRERISRSQLRKLGW